MDNHSKNQPFNHQLLRKKVSVFGVFLVRIQFQCGKIRTRKTQNTDILWTNIISIDELSILKTNFLVQVLKTWDSYVFRTQSNILTHFSPVSHFHTSWKHQKTKGFLTFSGGIEMWLKWVKFDWVMNTTMGEFFFIFQIYCVRSTLKFTVFSKYKEIFPKNNYT